MGNILIIVEHDEGTMLYSDVLIDIELKAESVGDEIVAIGIPKKVSMVKEFLTG